MEITAGDILFLDTNILLTATDQSRQHHHLARELIISHQRSGLHFGISGQIIREYMVVATRPVEANGLGLSPNDTIHNADEFRKRLLFFAETESVSNKLRMLIRHFRLSGTRIHDANVAATMLTHGLSKIVTENTGDFSDFSELQTFELPEIHHIVTSSS